MENFKAEKQIIVPDAFSNPLKLIFILTLSIFITEAAIMLLLSALPPMPPQAEALIDACLLTILLLPILYLFVYRPFRRHIQARKGMEESLRSLSITDPLTGLLNRRGFFLLAGKQLEIARRNKRYFSVLFIDLNDLKAINDEFGHEAGDKALADTGKILRETFRTSDIVARMGGDEFSVLLTGQSGNEVIDGIITATVYEKFADYNNLGENNFMLSASVGLSHYEPGSSASLDELLAQADRLMYEQKQRSKTSGLFDPADYNKDAVPVS